MVFSFKLRLKKYDRTFVTYVDRNYDVCFGFWFYREKKRLLVVQTKILLNNINLSRKGGIPWDSQNVFSK